MQEILFSESCKQWLETKKFSVKYSTYIKYEGVIERNIIPYFKDKRIEEIDDNFIISYFDELLNAKKYSSSTITTIRFLLRTVSKYIEIKYKILSCNLDFIKVSNKQNAISNLNDKQKLNLSNYCFIHYDAISFAVLIALYGGLRIGEICALKWEDFDFCDEYISVSKCVQRIKSKDSSKGKTILQISEPKTETSNRIVPIPIFLVEYIKEYKTRNEAEIDYYVLTNCYKTPDPRTTQYRFTKLCSKYDFKIKFHSLRHCYATSCVRQELDIKSISEILGHANVNTTLNLYVHSSLEQKRIQVNKISKP